MSDNICKCCGQTMPLPFDIELDLSKGMRELLDAVHTAGPYGISTDRLVAKLYDADPNGGPVDARKSVHVRVWQLNQKLRGCGWVIDGRGEHYGLYVLTRLPSKSIQARAANRMAMGAA